MSMVTCDNQSSDFLGAGVPSLRPDQGKGHQPTGAPGRGGGTGRQPLVGSNGWRVVLMFFLWNADGHSGGVPSRVGPGQYRVFSSPAYQPEYQVPAAWPWPWVPTQTASCPRSRPGIRRQKWNRRLQDRSLKIYCQSCSSDGRALNYIRTVLHLISD